MSCQAAWKRSRQMAEGTGIVGTEGFGRHRLQAGGRILARQRRRRGQHAAGEDIALDEIGAAAVVGEVAIGERDHLQPGAPVRCQARAQLGEEGGPVALAHRLEHLDRGQAVEAAGDVAIVLKPDLDPLGQARLEDALLRQLVLCPGHGDAGDAGAELPCGEDGEGTPAAADLEQPVPRRQADEPGETTALVELRLLQLLLVRLEARGRIEHGGVEPGVEEGVAEIVVGVDVAAAALAVVAAQRVLQPAQPAVRPAAVIAAAPGVLVAVQELEQRRQIVAIPVAGDVALGEADAAAQEIAAGDAAIGEAQARLGPGLVTTEAARGAVGEAQVQAAAPEVPRQRQDDAEARRPSAPGPVRQGTDRQVVLLARHRGLMHDRTQAALPAGARRPPAGRDARL